MPEYARADPMHQTNVDLAGLLTVVSEHLYSSPLVTVRELVQNAHDSITRRHFEDPAFVVVGARIDVEIEPGAIESGAAGIIRVRDTGAGLTEDEIHSFLATVGSGYTRQLREQIESGGGSDLIGLFGIGFLSAFVVADEVRVVTTSYRTPETTLQYSSRDGRTYRVDPVESAPIGSTVELVLSARHRDLADAGRITNALTRYATLLKYPIRVGGGVAINDEPPPWRDDRPAGSHERRQRELAFANRFETSFEPLATIAVTPSDDEPNADAHGLLWIQDGGSYGTSDNRNLSVFVRRMLLDDDARDLLPRWAGFVGGAIESVRLTPTASREDLQRDAAYDAVQRQLADAIIAGLDQLARREPDTWRRVLRRHNTNLIGAALSDERLFALVGNDVQVPTSEGDMTVGRLAATSPGGRLHVTLGLGNGFEDMLLRAQKIPVAKGEFFGVLSLMRRYAEHRGSDLIELGSTSANQHLFDRVELDGLDRAWLAEHLADTDEQLIAARFAPASVPLVVVPDREAELKRLIEDDDADNRISASALRLARMYTDTIEEAPPARLFINVDNTAIGALLAARAAQNPRAHDAVRLLRSVKALMTTAAEGRSIDLNDALDGISSTVTTLLGEPSAHHERTE
jgi:molecular chaperone HtpG